MTTAKKISVLLAALAASFSLSAQAYKDLSLSAEQRAADLVSRLTLEEKAALCGNASPQIERLGIPAYNWWNEALHGVGRNGKATSFPMPVGMAASFDTPLLEQVFTCVSDEARVKHRQADSTETDPGYWRNKGLTFWTPNINLFRDPRWGRGMETYGEDPYLTGQMGMAVVRGLQGPPDADVLKTHACAKHYAVHSGPESERHRFDAVVSERDLRESYLPAFKDLVTKAGVREVMTAYNRLRGYPCGASEYLLGTILRGEWGFTGIVTSDCGAIADFFRPGDHGYSADAAEAAAAAVRAGVDTECGWVYRQGIVDAVERGLLDEADLDRNLQRLLAERIHLGELDGIEGQWASLDEGIVECDAHRNLALKMAAESLVLLQNRDGILPLDPSAKVALIGPNYDNPTMQLGNYNGRPEHIVTLRQAMEQFFPDLLSFPAVGHISQEFAGLMRTDEFTCREALSHEEVLSRLSEIDIVIFAGGISPRLEGEDLRIDIPGFMGGDRTSLELPQVQRDLIKALHDAGKRVVLVNFSGSAMGLVPESVNCDAILQAWYPGQEGGSAIARALMGLDNSFGRLSVTFYRNAEQLPDFHDYNMAGHTYRFFDGDPLYPFGYGLSYTSFEYQKVKVRRGRVIVKLRNTGERDGDEVVQLYIRRPDDAQGPSKTLRAYKRVHVKAGRRVRVRIPLTDETFLWWSPEAGDMVALPGRYQILVGGSSDAKDLQVREYRYKI